ncbi:YrbL family protein [Comamonas aquatica]|uniref:YrbL family protein n=1 Tax=Comamonas aquatica TaxID=225991 RepID=UPI00244B592E|nr:YrbL family protein [Comamonas aquatica]MDH0382569.1 PhoP regulatory network YrbL family protein [Comamonas aquatica]MDH0430621.1 PhoP regulatory network YrbL family protein [Comamonas aquatica]MDH0941491.1 PhoP regulatory network YrbL family protein [Comamonas aquatica]
MYVDLDKLVRIGQGTVKNVYQHPRLEDRVIKVIKPELVHADGGFLKHSAWKRRMYQGVYRQFRRELVQYLQLCKQHYHQRSFVFPVETPYGLVATSQGLGLVTEKIVAPDGKGWTVEDLVRGPGLQDKHRQALDRFFQECIDLHIVFGEVNYAGIMYTESRRGYPEFVLVDGVGEKLLIPVRAMSKRISARYVKKIQQRIYAQIAEIERSQQPT